MNGNGITIVIFDSGAHGDTVEAVARRYAPGAIVDYRMRGDGVKIDYETIRDELKEIAANPGRVRIVQFSWGLPGWIGEMPPDSMLEPKNDGSGEQRGLEVELAALSAKGIYVVAAASDDSGGGKVGANYPACSPYCIPAMGSAAFCNRTRRGLVGKESSASRAASELSAALAVVMSAGAKNAYEVLRGLAIDDEFPRLRLNPPVEKHRWVPVESGRVAISVEPETLITRYKSDGKTVHWERFRSSTTTAEAGKEVVIGISGGVGKYALTMRRAA